MLNRRVGNRPSVTRHRPNRQLRFSSSSSSSSHVPKRRSCLVPFRLRLQNRPKKVVHFDVTGSHRKSVISAPKCNIPVTILLYSCSIPISQGIGIMTCHRIVTVSTFVKHISCDKPIISSVSSFVRFRPLFFKRTISNRPSKKTCQKSRLVRPETLDDRRDETMPTLWHCTQAKEALVGQKTPFK